MKRILIVAAVSAIAATASAQAPRAAPAVPTRVSAKALADVCAQDRSACMTYVLGATDAFAGALVGAARPQVVCPPKSATNEQIAQSAVRFIRAHPEEANTNAALVILAGLKAAYPCAQ